MAKSKKQSRKTVAFKVQMAAIITLILFALELTTNLFPSIVRGMLVGCAAALVVMLVQLVRTLANAGKLYVKELGLMLCVGALVVALCYTYFSGAFWQQLVFAVLLIATGFGYWRYRISTFLLFFICGIAGGLLL